MYCVLANVGGFQQGLAATFPGLRPPDMSTLPFTAPFPPTVTPPIVKYIIMNCNSIWIS